MSLNMLSRLAAVHDVAAITQQAAWALLGTLAVTAFLFSTLRGFLTRNFQDTTHWLITTVIIVLCLSSYDDIVRSLVELFDEMTTFFADRAGWDAYWFKVQATLEEIFSTETSQWDRLVGWLKGGALSVVVSITYYLQFVIAEWVMDFEAVIVALLYVMGPLMLACGVIAPQAIKTWLVSLLYVLLWGPILPFLMFVTLSASGNAIETGNVAAMMRQNIVLMFLSLATPIIALFVMGAGGVSSLAGAAIRIAPAIGSEIVGTTVAGYRSFKQWKSSSSSPSRPSAVRAQRPGDGAAQSPQTPRAQRRSPHAPHRSKMNKGGK